MKYAIYGTNGKLWTIYETRERAIAEAIILAARLGVIPKVRPYVKEVKKCKR